MWQMEGQKWWIQNTKDKLLDKAKVEWIRNVLAMAVDLELGLKDFIEYDIQSH